MEALMELHGSVEHNLAWAVRSARRLRDHPVHADTLQHWSELLHHARRELTGALPPSRETIEPLIVALEEELAERSK
jgi:hypothetical protein